MKHTPAYHFARAIELLGSQAAMAEACGVSQPAISKAIARGRWSGEWAIAIERALKGEVTREQLRPDLFSRKKSEAA